VRAFTRCMGFFDDSDDELEANVAQACAHRFAASHISYAPPHAATRGAATPSSVRH